MPRLPIPAPGFTLTKGRKPRLPPESKLLVQIRGNGPTAGWVDPTPWPIVGTRWKYEKAPDGRVIEHPGDVVAVKRID